MSFLELRFLGKMDLLALGGRPQPLKKPSQSQKGHFYKKMNALDDTKTSELSKSAKETENICDRLWHLSRWDKKQISKWHNWPKKHANVKHKIKLAINPTTLLRDKLLMCVHFAGRQELL